MQARASSDRESQDPKILLAEWESGVFPVKATVFDLSFIHGMQKAGALFEEDCEQISDMPAARSKL